jgi:hypothetical protein
MKWNFLLFYNALDLNNQKILCLPSIYQFDRTGTNLNHPTFLTMQSENNKFKHILILWPWIMKAVTLHQIIHSIIAERCHLILNAITFLSLIFLKQDWKGFWPKMPHSQKFPCGVRLKSRILTSKAQGSLKINQIVNAWKRCKMNVACIF